MHRINRNIKLLCLFTAFFIPSLAIAIPGDFNDDGVINALDLRLLQMRRLGLPVATPGDNPDLNRDGVVDSKDFGLLGQGIQGQTVVLRTEMSESTPGDYSIVGFNIDPADFDSITIGGVVIPNAMLSPEIQNGVVVGVRFTPPPGAVDGDISIQVNGQTSTVENARFLVTVSASVTEAREGAPATITVSLDKAAIDPITVQISTSDGSATSSEDYTSQTNSVVTIPAGSTSVTHRIEITDDPFYELTETFSFTLSSPLRLIGNTQSTNDVQLTAQPTFTQSIVDNDIAGVFDFDGDGVEDLLISDSKHNGAGFETLQRDTGSIYIIYGTTNLSGLPINIGPTGQVNLNELLQAGQACVFRGSESEELGDNIAFGDFDDDQVTDLAMTRNNGMFVVYGRKTEGQNHRWQGVYEPERLAFGGHGFYLNISSLSSQTPLKMADLDGDYHAELLIGSHFASSGTGQVNIVYGRDRSAMNGLSGNVDFPQLLATNDAARITGAANQFFGFKLAVCDFDSDGVNDLVVGHSVLDMTLQVFYSVGQSRLAGSITSDTLGDAQTTFSATGLGTLPSGTLQTGDIDGDGALDLVLPTGSQNPLYVFYGTTSGQSRLTGSETATTIASGQNGLRITGLHSGSPVHVADLDSGGLADIAFCSDVSTATSKLHILYGELQTQRLTGDTGIVALEGANRLSSISGDAANVFIGPVTSLDLDGDRRRDLLFIQNDGTTLHSLSLYFGSASTPQIATQPVTDLRNTYSTAFLTEEVPIKTVNVLQSTDFDKDGYVDLILSSAGTNAPSIDDSFYIVYGRAHDDPAGRFGANVNQLYLDTLVSNNLAYRLTFPQSSIAAIPRIGDFDGDGANDIAFGNSIEIIVVYGDPANQKPVGTESIANLETANRVLRVTDDRGLQTISGISFGAVGDFDNDTMMDLYFSTVDFSPGGSTHYTCVIYGGTRLTGMHTASSLLAGSRFLSISNPTTAFSGGFTYSEDIDGDNIADLTSYQFGTPTESWTFYGSSTRLTGEVTYLDTALTVPNLNLAGAEPTATGDFDGDSNHDVVFHANRDIYLLYGDGTRKTGTLDLDAEVTANQAFRDTSVEPIAQGITLGDFNNDGVDDLFLRRRSISGDAITVFALYGAGPANGGTRLLGTIDARDLSETASGFRYSVGNGSSDGTALNCLDFDGDGFDDLLISGSSINGHLGGTLVFYGRSQKIDGSAGIIYFYDIEFTDQTVQFNGRQKTDFSISRFGR